MHGGQKPDFCEDLHAHDFDARIMVLSGEITIVRDNKAETFKAGDHCEIAAGCQHTAKVGPEGVAYIVGKACRAQLSLTSGRGATNAAAFTPYFQDASSKPAPAGP